MTSTFPHPVTTDAGVYIALDDLNTSLRALIVGRAVDELNGSPPEVPVSVVAALAGINPLAPGEAQRFKVTQGATGTFAISGEPDRDLPNAAVTAYDLNLTVGADGYLHTDVVVHVPAASVFPLPPLQVTLRRPALWLKGRVTTPAGAPVAGVQVSVSTPPGMVGLQDPLNFAHSLGTPLHSVGLGAIGAGLPLLRAAHVGDTVLWLQDRTGLGADVIVGLGAGSWREYAVIDHLEGPLNLARQGRAVLRAPLAFTYQPAAPVVPVAPVGVPPPGPLLVRPAFAEDEVVFSAAPGALVDGVPVEVADPNPLLVEWRVVRQPVATTDVLGYYRIGPVGRAAEVRLHLFPPPAGWIDATSVLDYGQLENVSNLRT